MRYNILFFLLIHALQGTEPVSREEDSSPALVARIYPSRLLKSDWEELQLQVFAFGQQHQLKLLKQTQIFHPQLVQYFVDVEIGKTTFTSYPRKTLRGHWYLSADGGPAALYIEFFQSGRIKLEGIMDENLRISTVETQSGWEHVAYQRTFVPPTIAPAPGRHCSSSQTQPIVPPEIELRATPSLVQPEVLLVLDYATSSHFRFNFEETRKYFGVFYAAVNRIFETIKSPRIINVITGIVMTKNASVESFVIRGTESGLVDVAETLPGFGKWLFLQKSSLSNFDVAIWNTGLDLALLKNGSWSSEALGHAFIGSACHIADQVNYNVGLSEDKAGKFTGIRTHAHELAHLFGAAHDGQMVDSPVGNPGAVQCPWSDGFIMSYLFGSKNNFYFSYCSINQIQYMLRSSRGRCLLDFVQKPAQVVYNSTLPGSFLSLDDQCRSRHGQQYEFYQEYLAEVCVKLWCSTLIDQNSASVTTSGPALEGSPCSISKMHSRRLYVKCTDPNPPCYDCYTPIISLFQSK